MPIIVTAVLTTLVAVFVPGSHCCHLHSFLAELALLILTPALGCLWVARASTPGKAWLRTRLAVLLAIVVQFTYLIWLHSPVFPSALLSRASIEKETRLMRLRVRNPQPLPSPPAEPLEGAR